MALIILIAGLLIFPQKWQEKKIRNQIRLLRRSEPLFEKISPDIRVNGSTVLLTGQVGHRTEREQLLKLIGEIAGVDSVINRVRIFPEHFDFEKLQWELRHSLGEKLISDVSRLRFVTDQDMLILEGPVLRQADKLLIGQWVAQHSPLPLVVNDLTVTDSLSAEQRIVETNIYFDKNSSAVPENQVNRLKSIVSCLQSIPFQRLYILGFSDGSGNSAVNKKISLRRARAVKDFLIDAGIDSTKLRVVGMGDKFPLAPNRTPEERAMNRRVCFRFEMDELTDG